MRETLRRYYLKIDIATAADVPDVLGHPAQVLKKYGHV